MSECYKENECKEKDTDMKRVHVENWSTREKLALASCVARSGDQNWMSVSRAIRTLGGHPNRSADWYSQKQCAVQYELLLSNAGTSKRKKRNEKVASDTHVDTPGEAIVRKLRQERVDELRMLLIEYQKQYLKEKQELEDIIAGKMDDKLDDVFFKMEEDEKHEEEDEATYIKCWHEKKRKEGEMQLSLDHPMLGHSAPVVEVKPTSPLLTSLLQSPSPSLMHRGAVSGPATSLSSLLSSSPPVPHPSASPLRSPSAAASGQTTLSKLLESPPAMTHFPVSGDTSSPTRVGVGAAGSSRSSIAARNNDVISSNDQRMKTPTKDIEVVDCKRRLNLEVDSSSPVKIEPDSDETVTRVELLVDAQRSETDTVKSTVECKIKNILGEIKGEVDEITPVILNSEVELVTQMESEADSVEVVVETAESSNSLNGMKIKTEVTDEVSYDDSDTTHNQTNESDILDDQLDSLAELDSHAVEMIVVGPNQPAVVSVHHDVSSENIDDEASIVTMPSNDDSANNVDEVSKEESSVVASSSSEVTVEGKVLEEEVIKGEVLTSANKERHVTADDDDDKTEDIDEDLDDDLCLEEVVKSLGEVSPSEMKEIIEGAEIIVGDDLLNDDIIASMSDDEETDVDSSVAVDTQDATGVKDHQEKDGEEVMSKSVKNEVESGDAKEVGETVAADSSTSRLINDAEVGAGADSESVDDDEERTQTSSSEVQSTSDVVEAETSSQEALPTTVEPSDVMDKKVVEGVRESKPDEETSEQVLPEPDSSSCSVDGTETRANDEVSVADTVLEEGSPEDDASRTAPLEETEDRKEKETEVKPSGAQVSVTEKAGVQVEDDSSMPALTPASSLPLHIAAILPAATVEAIASSSSRPDTPSTEEDNEPVANLVKRAPRRLIESVPNSPMSTTEDGASQRAWKKSIMLVYNRLATHKFASLFLKPITDEQAHGYHSVVHRPMDLSTIKKNIESGALRTTVEFQRDMLLMFQNAIMYNNSKTLVYERAAEMQKECIQEMQLMVEAMGEGVPLRRESLVADKLVTRNRQNTKQDQEQPMTVTKRKRNQLSNSAAVDSPKRRKGEDS